ncbi:MAG: hypothetical protein JXL97_08285 [Bacteroidales bacterium]|nr:hypothetical protein [Bacteroidales bacterium]
MIFEQPSIFPFGIRFDEPVTTITDLAVSFICFYAFFKLNKIKKRIRIHAYLRFYFLSMGIATFIGGVVGHGFLYLFDAQWEAPEWLVAFLSKIVGEGLMNEVANPWKLPGWLTSMFSIALVERASIEYARPFINKKVGKFFSWLNIIELMTFVTITFATLNFFFVEIHTAYGFLVIVLSFSLIVYLKTKKKGSKLFLIAIGFSSIGALFFMNKWGLSPWFNHFDISHTFLAFSAIFFYKGAKEIFKEPVNREISKNLSQV